MPASPTTHYKNRILAALQPSEIAQLSRHLEPVNLKVHAVLADGHAAFGYFLEEGLASAVIMQKNGATVEVGVIGIDGVVGLSILWGVDGGPGQTFVQIDGGGYRIRAKPLKEAFDQPGTLQTRLHKYMQAFMVQATQNAACNRHHEIAQRLARWLLTCHDRTQSDHMPLTHEFLGNMLGAPRATVTLAAGQLHKAGFIDYTRGNVTITNRAELENAACECYQTVRNEFRRLNLL